MLFCRPSFLLSGPSDLTAHVSKEHQRQHKGCVRNTERGACGEGLSKTAWHYVGLVRFGHYQMPSPQWGAIQTTHKLHKSPCNTPAKAGIPQHRKYSCGHSLLLVIFKGFLIEQCNQLPLLVSQKRFSFGILGLHHSFKNILWSKMNLDSYYFQDTVSVYPIYFSCRAFNEHSTESEWCQQW